mgnify:CR=1 FL=1
MSRRSYIFILSLTFLLICFSSFAQAAEYKIRFASDMAPTHPVGIASKCFKAAVEEYTKGRVEVSIYLSSALGKEVELLESVRTGSIETATAGIALMASVVPELDIFGLPFVFRDYEHLWKVLQNPPFRALLISAIQKRGYYPFGFTTGGPRAIFMKKPINSINDLKGTSIRVYEIPGIIEAIKAIGARPVVIPFAEVYMSLQSGLADGGETSVPAYMASKFYEVCKHVARLNYMDNGRVYYMNSKYWEALPPDIKKSIEKAGRLFERLVQAGYEQQEWLANETLQKLGVKIYNPPIEPFIEAMQPVYAKLPPTIGKEWIKKIQAIE